MIPNEIVRIPRKVEVRKIRRDSNFPRRVGSEKFMIISTRIIKIIAESWEYFILWMFLDASLESWIVSMNARIPEIIIVRRMRERLVRVSSGINLEMAAAAPVLVLWIE